MATAEELKSGTCSFKHAFGPVLASLYASGLCAGRQCSAPFLFSHVCTFHLTSR